ncbi:MAG: hypothetical protein IJ536_08695, partial [Acidaminococcaceae bacterium]|nr:hypothetical protein [Acidaminococcaceae bacterium]
MPKIPEMTGLKEGTTDFLQMESCKNVAVCGVEIVSVLPDNGILCEKVFIAELLFSSSFWTI